MIFVRYFLKRYFYYVGALALLLTILLALIELLEKLMRVSHASLADIGVFLGLYSVPLFFDNCALAGWLAAALLLREFFVLHEWDLMMMLNINNKELMRLFALAGILLMSSVVMSKELFVSSLAFKAEQFKIKHFKLKVPELLVNRWMQLQENKFCYIGALDMSTKRGQDITLLTMSGEFSIEQALVASNFQVDPKLNQIFVGQGNQFNTVAHQCVPVSQKILVVPEFFSQITFENQAPTVWHYYQTVRQAGKQLPDFMFNKLLYQLFKKLSLYFQVFLYPLITALLFIMWYDHVRLRWAALLITYPFFLIIDTLFDFFISYGCSALIVPLFYVVFGCIIIFTKKYFLK